jgi:two-component system cell cycle response regulator DivK
MSGKRIVIVEDNARNRKLLRDVLSHHGYEVYESGTGEDGLALVATVSPDLIMLDIQLPGIDGLEALRRLRADDRTRAIPTLAVTASVMGQDIERIRTAGFDGYLQKPVGLKELLAAVAAALAAPRADGAP